MFGQNESRVEIRGRQDLFGTSGSGVFKLGISGLIFTGCGNIFFLISGCRDMNFVKIRTSGFHVFKPGILGSGPLLPPLKW